ncbi:hypothetical protein [Thiohalorhabdus methylotrophus]|uniref:AAA+ ATPase domain-containing protein n=1 Tax=Thiohalorhabdus methylotrophus TaxID=3242694 RepID=A0ABV4TVA6_9GAMM
MPTQLKDQVPYPFVHPDDLLDELSESMLLSAYTHGREPDIDARVASGYEHLFGIPFDPAIVTFSPELDDDPMPGVTLHGPPGHGKSTVMKMAARRAAKAMGMYFKDMDEEVHEAVTKEDFLFAIREMAGQVSAVSFAGIPSKAERNQGAGSSVSYMETLPERVFALMPHAGVGVLVLEDLGNADQRLIPSVLGVVNDRRYGQNKLGDRAWVGITTNLGRADGAVAISRMGTALDNRVEHYYVEDNLDHWVQRYQRWLARSPAGRIGDVGFVGFLRQHEDIFYSMPPKDGGPFPSPRSLEKLAKRLPSLVYRATGGRVEGALDGGELSLVQLQTKASGLIGSDAGFKLASYLHAYLTHAAPLATKLVRSYDTLSAEEVEATHARIRERYGTGTGARESEFGLQLCLAAADQAATAIIRTLPSDGAGERSPEVVEAIRIYTGRIGEATQAIHRTQLWAALRHFVDRLSDQLPAPYLDSRVVVPEVARAMRDGFAPYFRGDQDEFADVISTCADYRAGYHDQIQDVLNELEAEAEATGQGHGAGDGRGRSGGGAHSTGGGS